MAVPRLQVRHGFKVEWVVENPVLKEGELGFETDTGQGKEGNGEDSWNDLPYIGGTGGGSTFGDIDGGEAESIYGGTDNIDGGDAAL